MHYDKKIFRYFHSVIISIPIYQSVIIGPLCHLDVKKIKVRVKIGKKISEMRMKILFLALQLLYYSNAFSTDASTEACQFLNENYQSNVALTSELPVILTFSAGFVQQGHNLTVTMDAQRDFELRGFIIQARAIGVSSKAVGSFSLTGQMKTIKCSGLPANSVATYTNNSLKRRIEFIWQAPVDFAGFITFQ